jgi:hypothetical protein
MFTKNVKSQVYEEHIDDFIIHHEVIKITFDQLNEMMDICSGGCLRSQKISQVIPAPVTQML